jgi:hypothetical protein
MGAGITYMGTKRAIASAVTEVIGQAQPGTLLDVFSGMCAVGEAVGPSRRIWNNDVQYDERKVLLSVDSIYEYLELTLEEDTNVRVSNELRSGLQKLKALIDRLLKA